MCIYIIYLYSMKLNLWKTSYDYSWWMSVNDFFSENQDVFYLSIEESYQDDPQVLNAIRNWDTDYVWDWFNQNEDYIKEIMIELYELRLDWTESWTVELNNQKQKIFNNK